MGSSENNLRLGDVLANSVAIRVYVQLILGIDQSGLGRLLIRKAERDLVSGNLFAFIVGFKRSR